MKKIIKKIDKNNIASSQSVYKWLKGSVIWDNAGKEFYKNNDLGKVINFNSILVSPIDWPHPGFGINCRLKRIFDIFFAVIIISIILTWLIPVLAILIKLDSKGPVFFLQKRNKRKGKIFTCIKLRTMIVNEGTDLEQVAGNDKRITRIGKFLRKNHIDEFPQFINVLLGDMSVIGPRPHMISDNLRYEELIQAYSYRLMVKPGITGLAQVMGFSGTITNLYKMKKRVFFDLYYIKHWSFSLDVKIIFLTITKNFRKQKNGFI